MAKTFTKLLAIDFETPNSFHDCACSLGIAMAENGEIILSKEFLINPESHFDETNIEIHKITKEMVNDKPTFPEIWKELKELIDENTLIIAHNANFDISVLKKLILRYKLDTKDFNYCCSHDAYRKNRILDSYKLSSIASGLNLTFEHHRAGEDALVCLQIFMDLLENKDLIKESYLKKTLNLDILSFDLKTKKKFFERNSTNNFFKKKTFKASDIKATVDNFDENNPVFGKTFVITGDLLHLELKEAAQQVVNLGGIYKDSVVKSTNYLIIGTNLQTNSPSIGTTKYNKAKEKFINGDDIQLINEDEFLDLIGYEEEIIEDSHEIAVTKISEPTTPVIKESKDFKVTTEEIKTSNANTDKEDFGQLSFDLFGTNETPKSNNSVETEKSTNSMESKAILEENKTSNLSFTKYVAPKNSFNRFSSADEKLELLKQYKLLSAKASSATKEFFYKGVFTEKAIPCNIIGYDYEDVLVIEVDNNLHCIRAEYLKQMQDSKFSNFASLVEA
ncbi:MAG: exonuclease domain-containing protein [Sarcina sp.]